MLRNRSLLHHYPSRGSSGNGDQGAPDGLAVHPRVGSGTIGIFDFVTACYTERCFRNVLLACSLARCQRRKESSASIKNLGTFFYVLLRRVLPFLLGHACQENKVDETVGVQ